jgi:hypothetical protein
MEIPNLLSICRLISYNFRRHDMRIETYADGVTATVSRTKLFEDGNIINIDINA